jgi:NAD(P)-dependent dehydrogenase (short-subunit alcohol dehydrogenase family)
MNQPRTALITGAGSGIGRCLAGVLAQDGYAIAGIDLREDGVRSLVEQLASQQKRAAWRVADVTDAKGLAAATRELEFELGPIDLLVANAGIGIETTGLNYDVEAMNKVIGVNLIGVSNSIGAVLPGMIERKRGHLVGISSVASYRGLPRLLAYCASKSGVNAIFDGLRVELQPLGIDVTIVCPSWVRTPLTERLEGLEDVLDVDAACAEIAYAIRHKLDFHAFPRMMRWKLNFMLALPRSWQDGMVRSMTGKIKVKKQAD